MKLRSSLALLLLSFSPILTQAQAPSLPLPKIDLGIKAGADFSKLSGDNWDQSMKPGIVGGAFLGFRKGKFGIQIEALLNTAKYSGAGLSSGTDLKTTNLNIPLLLQYKLIPMLWLQIGPQYSTVLSASSSDASISDPKSFFKSSFNGVIGLELKLPIKFNVGARYILGLSDVNNISGTIPGAWQQRSAELYLGFRFL